MELETLELESINYGNENHLLFLKELMTSSNMGYLWDLTNINDKEDNSDGFIVLNEEKDKIGFLSFSQPTEAMYGKTVNIYYAILEKYRNKGYAKKLVKELSNYLFNIADINCIVAEVNINNIPSQKVLLKSGYEKIYEDEDDMEFIQVRGR